MPAERRLGWRVVGHLPDGDRRVLAVHGLTGDERIIDPVDMTFKDGRPVPERVRLAVVAFLERQDRSSAR